MGSKAWGWMMGDDQRMGTLLPAADSWPSSLVDGAPTQIPNHGYPVPKVIGPINGWKIGQQIAYPDGSLYEWRGKNLCWKRVDQ